MTLYLHGLGHFHPDTEITNQFLTDLDIGTNDEWITERVGIQSRRTVMSLDYIRETKNVDPSGAAEATLFPNTMTSKHAAEMALERAGLSNDDIGMVITGSSRPGTLSPADACNIAAELGMEVPAFDINSACTSFNLALYMLSMMRPEALPEFVLVVAPESLTTTVDYSDRSAAVLWGDGAAAAIVSTKVPSRMEILGNTFDSNPAGNDKVVVPHFGHFRQEGRTVQMFAIKRTIKVLKGLKADHHDPGREFHFIGHQANLRMLETVCSRSGIDNDHHHFNVIEYGNTGSAGSPSVVSMNWDRWTEHDDIGIVGVGSGLSWSGFVLRFGEAP